MEKIKSGFTSCMTSMKSCSCCKDSPISPLMIGWLLAGILSIAIPAIKWTKEKNDYYGAYGYYMEEEDNGNNNKNNNNNANYYYEDCAWWNWGCRKDQYQYAMYENGDNNNENGGQVELPDWYILLGGQTEEMRRWQEENTGRNGSTGPTTGERFVYIWQLLMFFGLLAYGMYVFHKKQSKFNLTIVCLLFAQFCLCTIIMATQGVISSDDRELEDSVYGWYGQMGVLIAYQSFWFFLFTVLFSVGFGIQALMERRKLKKEGKESQSGSTTAPATEYTTMEETPANESGA